MNQELLEKNRIGNNLEQKRRIEVFRCNKLTLSSDAPLNEEKEVANVAFI